MEDRVTFGYMEDFNDWALEFAPKLVIAIGILIIGLWLVQRIAHVLDRGMQRAHVGPEVMGFFRSMAVLALKFVVVLIAAGVLGFEISSILGILTGVVFAIGLALQGFLGNFAAGATIVFFKPYKVGDWVQISDTFGKVLRIEIFNTVLITPGDKTLIIPNGQVTDHIITNFSTQGRMRLELSVMMPYEESFPRVKAIIQDALKDFPMIMADPEPLIGIESYDSHSIKVSVRPYIHPDNYWEVTFEALERIKRAFSESGISVAYSEGIELGRIGI